MPWVLGLLALSGVLNAAYFLPIVYAAWFRPPRAAWRPAPRGRLETDWRLLWPTVLTAVLTLAAGLFANAFMSPLDWAKLIAEREYLR